MAVKAAQPPQKKRRSIDEAIAEIDARQAQRPSIDSLIGDLYAPAASTAEAERPGLLSRFLNRAQASTMQMGADLGEMLAGIPSPGARPVANLPEARAQGMAGARSLRERAAAVEAQVPAAESLPEFVASGLGYMAPDIAATVMGTKGVSALAKGVRPTSVLGRILAPEATAGVLRRNIPGAIAAAPITTVPGALSEESQRSATGTLGEMLTGQRPGMATRVAGDIALDVLGGAAAEKLLVKPVARLFGAGRQAPAAAATAAAEEAAPRGPLLLGSGAIPMGPAGSTAQRQMDAAIQFATMQRAGRPVEEVVPPPAPTGPRLLTRGAIPMGPAGSTADRQLQEAIRWAESQRAARATREAAAPSTPTPEVVEDPSARLAELAQQAQQARQAGAPAIEVVPALEPRTAQRQRKLRREMAESKQQLQADIDDRRALAMPDVEATQQLEAAAAAGRQQRAAQPGSPILGGGGFYTSMLGGGQLGEALGTAAGRELLSKVGLGVAGYELEQRSEDPLLRATGQGLQTLSALSLGYRPAKALVRSGAVMAKDALAASPQGRMALNLISRDILIDPKIRELVDYAEKEMATYRAKGLDLARQAQKLGPEGDRLVSDLIEGESIQPRTGLDDETIKAAMAVAQKAADDIAGMGQAKVETGLISPATFAKRRDTYLKRIYAAFKGGDATNPVVIRKGNKVFRIEPERVRNENLSVEERNALGEIREASVRFGETFTRGGKNIATSRLYNGLANIEGVIEPAYKQAMEEAENARLLADAAQASGDTEMTKAARAAELESKRRMRGMASELVKGNDQYVQLPDTPNLSFLRGAVVRKDAAEYLMTMPDVMGSSVGVRSVWDGFLRFWKKVHTVYNPGTHVANSVSNAVKVHMGGIPLVEQPKYLASAWKDLRNYGPATKALAESGVLERGIPTYGDMAVEGVATQKKTLQQLVGTTRPETRQVLQARGVTAQSPAGKFIDKASLAAQHAYALEDGIYRVALFQKLTQGGMDADAAIKEVERVLPGYDTRSPLLTGLKNTISPFILYPAKYIPSLVEDIMDHPVRWATLAALWGGLDQVSRQQYTPLQERDLRPEQRRSRSMGYVLPGVTQVDAVMQPLAKLFGAEPKKGERYTIDFSRYTPLSSFTGSPAPGSVVGKLFPGVPGASLIQPSGPIPELAARAANVDPFTGREWLTGGESPGERAYKVATDVALPLLAPTAVSYYGKKMLEQTLPSKNRTELLSDVLGLVGARPQLVRPGVQAKYERRDYQDQLRAVKSKRDTELRRTESPEREAEVRQEAAQKMQRIRSKYFTTQRALREGAR